MSDAAVKPGAEQRKRLVAGHDANYKPVPEWNIAAELAGVGGVRASMNDMVKLAEALAGKRETPLKEAIALATKPQRPSGGRNSTGLGWVVHERPDVTVVWHNGGTGGFRSMIAVNRQAGKAAVVLVDSAQSFDDLGLHLVDPGAPPMKVKRVALPTDAEARKQYVGAYELRPNFIITVFEDGERLMSQATGQGAFEIFREAPDRFFLRVVEAQLVFNRGADGKVESLTLHQNGREIPGKRLQ
jgi:CubicO group peptidase (beta-lactamase class C family)